HEFIQTPSAPTISINISQTNQIIGTDVSVVQIVNVLRKLGFSVEVASDEQFLALKAPVFRHDIANKQDIAEEILRMYGIDKIAATPLQLHEQRSLGEHYTRYHFARSLAARARSVGFSETIHFIFNQSSRLRELGFATLSPMQDLQNPITEELNTLRPTLLLSLLDTMHFNIRNGKKAVNLFEIGSVFDAERVERVCMAFVSNGIMREARYPSSKDCLYDIYGFAESLARVIGAFSLEALSDSPVQLFHPAQSAHIVQNGTIIGTLATLHPAQNLRFETDIAFIAEIELSLLQRSSPHFVPFSKMQKSQRDLSVLISDSIPFAAIRNAIKALAIAEIRELYPLDIYRDDKMPENQQSLTIRLILQNEHKSLEESDISDIMQRVLQALGQQFGAVLR
ncbi:MAG: phenylalanine--tRNA ligase subunit beta, partial [Helicobacter sp.]|nr:phenylalanine--tRNA ligase subunit beta [Helicobacter sp.]